MKRIIRFVLPCTLLCLLAGCRDQHSARGGSGIVMPVVKFEGDTKWVKRSGLRSAEDTRELLGTIRNWHSDSGIQFGPPKFGVTKQNGPPSVTAIVPFQVPEDATIGEHPFEIRCVNAQNETVATLTGLIIVAENAATAETSNLRNRGIGMLIAGVILLPFCIVGFIVLLKQNTTQGTLGAAVGALIGLVLIINGIYTLLRLP